MKSIRVIFPVLLISLGATAFAQSHEHASAAVAAESDAQKEFAQLKTLAGKWQGSVDMGPNKKASMEVSLRVTSRGNTLVHEMKEAGTPDDPAKYDHPVTMFYLDDDRLTLLHYCDAGNRPRMVARTSADGKTVEFDFLDVAGSTKYGHMQHAVFTIVDADHHIEDWTYLMPGDKPMRARIELTRAK
jgi:hypothetical protein